MDAPIVDWGWGRRWGGGKGSRVNEDPLKVVPWPPHGLPSSTVDHPYVAVADLAAWG